MQTRTVGDTARRIIQIDATYYGEELMQLIPSILSAQSVMDDNANDLMLQLDEIRFAKEAEFAKYLGVEVTSENLFARINSPIGSLPPDEESKRREIKFLFNVAAAVIHS